MTSFALLRGGERSDGQYAEAYWNFVDCQRNDKNRLLRLLRGSNGGKNSLLCFKDALSLLESEIGFAQNCSREPAKI